MNIYLVCKHRTVHDHIGKGFYTNFTVEKVTYSLLNGKTLVDKLNKSSKKYLYKLKRMELKSE